MDRLTERQGRLLRNVVDLSSSSELFEFASSTFSDPERITSDGKALLESGVVTWAVLLPGQLSRDQVRELANKIQRVDDFDIRLLRALSECSEATSNGDSEIVLRGLDLIDYIGVKPRLFLGLIKFMKHPNSKVRSKAARIVGQITANQGWINRHVAAIEPRVRSNVLEALAENPQFGKSELWEVLVQATHDRHHRVAVTALFLLARLGDAESLGRLGALQQDGEPRVRRSAAWALSQLERSGIEKTTEENRTS